MKVDLESEVTVWFKQKDTFFKITVPLDNLLEYTKNDLLDILDSKYNNCTCNLKYCECGSFMEDFKDAEIDSIEFIVENNDAVMIACLDRDNAINRLKEELFNQSILLCSRNAFKIQIESSLYYKIGKFLRLI